MPWRTEHLCGITIKGKWERDALRPGNMLFVVSGVALSPKVAHLGSDQLFFESHPQKVADLGSDFGLVGLQNTLA